jgi:hypothetical protein
MLCCDNVILLLCIYSLWYDLIKLLCKETIDNISRIKSQKLLTKEYQIKFKNRMSNVNQNR